MSTASIGSKNYHAIKASKSAEIVAVASRSLEKAREWAASRDVRKAYGSYEELLADPEIDAVYIPLPTSLHKEWVGKAAAAGKHVLVEKPCALNLPELEGMIRACSAAGVVWMDGVMFMHHDRQHMMMDMLRKGELGTLRRLDSGFSFCADKAFLESNIRVQADLDRLGALGDLGWYQARFALCAFDLELPTHVTAVAHASTAGGVPIDVSVCMYYAGNEKVATFDSSFRTGFRQWVEVAGTAGALRCDDFVVARNAESVEYSVVKGADLVADHRRVADERSTVQVKGVCQEANMFDTFSAVVAERAGGGAAPAAGSAAHWRRVSVLTQAIMDACMASVDAGGAKVPVPVPAADI
jgi:predicted dehydrogenase